MRKMEARGICGGGGGGGAQARSFDEGPTDPLFLFCISPQVDEEGGGGDEKEANEEEEEETKRRQMRRRRRKERFPILLRNSLSHMGPPRLKGKGR